MLRRRPPSRPGTFTVLPDGGRMEQTVRLGETPKTGCREQTITSPLSLRNLADDAAIHRIFPVAYGIPRARTGIRGRPGISSRVADGICAAAGLCGEQAIPGIRESRCAVVDRDGDTSASGLRRT